MAAVRALALEPRSLRISKQQYHQHWATVHREMVVHRNDNSPMPYHRFVQFHAEELRVPPFTRAMYDGVAECWFEDLASVDRLLEDPYQREIVQQDERVFVDMSRFRILFTVEDQRIAGPEMTWQLPFTKVMLLTRRRPEVTREEFAAWWTAELPRQAQESVPSLCRYVQSLPLLEAYPDTEPAYDGVIELWWGRPADQDNEPVNLGPFAKALQDAPLDVSRTESLIGNEFLIFDLHRERSHPVYTKESNG
ncbi:MAG: EthD domain-containing protein [Chloroflexota bacterium]